MIIPGAGKKINYRYLSSIISINITLTVNDLKHRCKNISIEGPFIGKYFAIIYEDENKISLLSFGKGLYYGNITEESLDKSLFSISKPWEINRDVPVDDKFILSFNKKKETIKIGNKIFENCMVLNLIYDKGKYIICIKEGIGLILIQNIVNNIIKDEIQIQEA